MRCLGTRLAWAGFALFLCVGTSHAEVVEGTYTGSFRGHGGSTTPGEAFVRTVRNSQGEVEMVLGLLIRKDCETDAVAASLFRIEDHEEGSQAWVQLFQNGHGRLAVDSELRPTYEGTFVRKREGDRSPDLRLAPTEFGRTLGCVEDFEGETDRNDRYWADLPKGPVRYEGDEGTRSALEKGRLDGRFEMDGQTISGSYSLEEMLPGVGVLRSVRLESAGSGSRSVKADIEAIVVHIWDQRDFVFDALFPDARYLQFIRLVKGKRGCWSDADCQEED